MTAGSFHTTRWTQVIQARERSEAGLDALCDLCATYYAPVIVFLRRQGNDADAARELAHEFFAQVPEGDAIGGDYRGDGTGYNVTIDFKDSRTYTATWHGCLGQYGVAEGTWSVAGNLITLKPTVETGMMKGHLRQLNIVRKGSAFVFVPDLKNDYYRKYGADDYSAFHKQTPKPRK